MLDEHRIHDEISAFRVLRPLWVAHRRAVASSKEPASVSLKVAEADDVGFGALGSFVEDMLEHDTISKLVLTERHGGVGNS